MKRISILFYSLLLLVVTSCSPSEEEINAAAKQTVNDFFTAVSFEDMDNINRIYPSFEKINTELKKITFEKVEVGDIKANMDNISFDSVFRIFDELYNYEMGSLSIDTLVQRVRAILKI